MSTQDDPFDWKHHRLWRMSKAADVLSVIVAIGFLLLAIYELVNYNSLANARYQTDLIGLFSREPIFILDVLSQVARVFLEGAFYYLMLKGIALGLDMIVETDINYRAQEARGASE